MPDITFEGETIECASGRNLLRTLPKEAVSATGPMSLCKSGTCGMCTVRVQGDGVSEPSDIEESRISDETDECGQLRLACQTQVLGDIEVSMPDDD